MYSPAQFHSPLIQVLPDVIPISIMKVYDFEGFYIKDIMHCYLACSKLNLTTTLANPNHFDKGHPIVKHLQIFPNIRNIYCIVIYYCHNKDHYYNYINVKGGNTFCLREGKITYSVTLHFQTFSHPLARVIQQ